MSTDSSSTYTHSNGVEVDLSKNGVEVDVPETAVEVEVSVMTDDSSPKESSSKQKAKASYLCTICNQQFNHMPSLNRHMTIHNSVGKFECPYCGMRLTKQSRLTRHLRSHSGERPYTCTVCNKSFTDKANLGRHMLVHLDEREEFQCTQCSGVFKNKGSLNYHVIHTHLAPKKRVAEPNEAMKYSCEVCGKTFDKKKLLYSHRRYHFGKKKFECTVCGKRFLKQYHLNIHANSHSRIDKGKLNISTNSHSRIDKGKLNISTNSHSRIDKGKLNISTNFLSRIDKGNPYTCDICNESFKYKEVFLIHRQVHTGRPWQDDVSTATGIATVADGDANLMFKSPQSSTDQSLPGNKSLTSSTNTNMSTDLPSTPNHKNYVEVDVPKNRVQVKSDSNETGLKLQCFVCCKRFMDLNQLQSHYFKTHSKVNPLFEKIYECSHCHKLFGDKIFFNMHVYAFGDRENRCGKKNPTNVFPNRCCQQACIEHVVPRQKAEIRGGQSPNFIHAPMSLLQNTTLR